MVTYDRASASRNRFWATPSITWGEFRSVTSKPFGPGTLVAESDACRLGHDGLGYLAVAFFFVVLLAALPAGARLAVAFFFVVLLAALPAGARLAVAFFFVVLLAAFLPDAFRALPTMVIDPAPGMRDDSSPVDHTMRRSSPATPVTTPSRGA